MEQIKIDRDRIEVRYFKSVKKWYAWKAFDSLNAVDGKTKKEALQKLKEQYEKNVSNSN